MCFMKAIKQKLSWLWIAIFSILIPASSKAAAKKDLVSRINKVRKILNEVPQSKNNLKISGEQFMGLSEAGKWVNWGNWANWNNWNNWANWSNWGNWGNWRNF
jgi:hypothetical protein